MLKHQKTKTLSVRENRDWQGNLCPRSADAIAPNFIYNCAGCCFYCTVHRFTKALGNDNIYINENTNEILDKVNEWVESKRWPKPSNSADPKYWVIEIGNSTDICLHWKHYDWSAVFDYFMKHPKLKATFATKYPSNADLPTLPDQYKGKIRIRVSLMPELIKSVTEGTSDNITRRLKCAKEFIKKGYEVHFSFAPIIVVRRWEELYSALFEQINKTFTNEEKSNIKCECIFLTHHPNLHKFNTNSEKRSEAEHLMWVPELQEEKQSQYQNGVVRYKRKFKKECIDKFKALISKHIPWCEIRYIF